MAMAAMNLRAMRASGGMRDFRDDLADLIDRGNYSPLSPEDGGNRVRCIVIGWRGYPP